MSISLFFNVFSLFLDDDHHRYPPQHLTTSFSITLNVHILTFSTAFTFFFTLQRTFFHKHEAILQRDHEEKIVHLSVDSNLHSSFQVMQRKKN